MKKLRLIKATPEQKAAYKADGGVYPLHGYVDTIVDGVTIRCAIEDLRNSWSRPDPVWECRFPEGYSADGCHGMLENTLVDAIFSAGFARRCEVGCYCRTEGAQ